MRKTLPLTMSLISALAVTSVADAQIGLRGKMRERMMQRLQEKKAEEERPIDLLVPARRPQADGLVRRRSGPGCRHLPPAEPPA